MNSNVLYGPIYDNYGCSWIFGRRSVKRVSSDAGGFPGTRPSASKLTPTDKARLAGVVSNAPQAFVKVISRTYNASSVSNTLNYIGRDGDLELETRDGLLTDADDLADMVDDWVMHSKAFDQDGRSARASITTHMVLSMPPETDRAAFKEAVRDFVRAEFDPRHDYALAFHDDTDHPHAHLVVLSRDDEGKALQIGRINLDRWREQFAEALRGHGIDADASPRHARGAFDKTARSADHHARQKGYLLDNRRQEIEAIHETLLQNQQPLRPWDQAMAERREAICATYRAAATELGKSSNTADRQLGERLAAFERTMAPARTRHVKTTMAVAQRHQALHDAARSPDRREHGRPAVVKRKEEPER